MPEVGDHYIWAEILLPRGEQIARGHVVVRSRDAKGNVMGRSHTNILDTRMIWAEFAGGKVTELTTNVIADSMCTQCDSEGNEYLFLDALVDCQNDNKVISLSDQHITIQGRPITPKTAACWQICCQWKDGPISWEKLSGLKEADSWVCCCTGDWPWASF